MIFIYMVLVVAALTACGSSPRSGGKAIGGSTDQGNAAEAVHKKTSDLSSRERTPPSRNVYTIVIDPGHGGEDPGATAVNGRFEKEFTLSMAQALASLLEKDSRLQVKLTRSDDTFISTQDLFRPKFANEQRADLFISIHGNTFGDPSVSGTESFYYHDQSLDLANIIHKHVVMATGFNDRGVKNANYFVLRETQMPAVLLELGYLTNPENDENMWTPDFQQSAASSIYKGIKEYLKLG
ncbi:N-acetylmuramoyl-L-alanine amidase [Paenibacillus sp. XY044]|uniref:N-acetylmuramoyl-L-alanine amidase family protein n=1 Tax=Paenibacillus sp. XY044 TaxID=2026089 RepID=UPI00211B6219|nr:N-acetylmuramoyl-L-alanine amidase [Paenibacillus sp. XY044]